MEREPEPGPPLSRIPLVWRVLFVAWALGVNLVYFWQNAASLGQFFNLAGR